MTHWIVPTNYSLFRLEDYLHDFNDIVWLHRSNFEVGDMIYIYATAPIKRLTYVMEVVKTNISHEEYMSKYDDRDYSYGFDDKNKGWNNKYSVFRLVSTISHETNLSLDDLKLHGCKSSMQSSIKVQGKLLDYIQRELSATTTADSEFKQIATRLRQFSHERDWEQFHDAKNLALALAIEVAELNECFLWKQAEDADPAKVEEELVDVLLYAVMLADKYGFDIKDICMKKIERNAQKYPVDKAKGSAKKYNEL